MSRAIPVAADELARRIRPFAGELLRPGDAGYEDARRIHNGLIDKRPALIARCRGTADVVGAVNAARETGYDLSVRGGGHNVAGRAVTDGGLMIDLSAMQGVAVDPASRTTRAGGGATWGMFDAATQAHGLAVTGGMISSTGIAGLTLGGGLGWLMGRHGLTVDNLLGAEVVTADGGVVTASPEEHPDLFWALRGGGGNFGVVTSFLYRVHPIGPVVTGFLLAYPFGRAGDVLHLYRELTSDGPDDLTVNAALVHAPDGSGTKLAALVGCHVGTAAEAERDLRSLMSLGPSLTGTPAPMQYTAINSILDAGYPRGALNYWKSSFLRGLSDEAVQTMITAFADCPSPMSVFVLENLHGQVTRVAVDATPVPHREHGYNFLITSVWHDPLSSDLNVSWTRDAFAAMEPHTIPRRYVNYVAADETGNDAVRESFGPNYPRLVEVKRAYDQGNLFRLNQNIHPA